MFWNYWLFNSCISFLVLLKADVVKFTGCYSSDVLTVVK